MAKWISSTKKVICIDGCFLKCHSRILENAIEKERLVVFDALSYHGKFNDLFDIDEVSSGEIQTVAETVSSWVLQCLESGTAPQETKARCGI